MARQRFLHFPANPFPADAVNIGKMNSKTFSVESVPPHSATVRLKSFARVCDLALTIAALVLLAMPGGCSQGRAADLRGLAIVPDSEDLEAAFPQPTTLEVTFPKPFTNLPALLVRPAPPNPPDGAPFRISKLTTNSFEVEVVPIALPLLKQARPGADESAWPEFSDNSCFSFYEDRPALVDLKPEGGLFVSLSTSPDGQAPWTVHAVDLSSLLADTGQARAAALANGRLTVLWTGPAGLCVSQAAGPLGELPWITDVVTNVAPEFDRACVAKVGSTLAASLVKLEEVDSNTLRAHLTVWQTADEENLVWQRVFQRVEELPQIRPDPSKGAHHQIVATRIGSYRDRLLVSVGSFSTQQHVSCFLGCSYWAISTGKVIWYLPGAEQLVLRLDEYSSEERFFGPLDQVIEFQGHPALIHREIGYDGDASFEVRPPQLLGLPGSVRWEAAAQPQITGIGSGFWGELTVVQGFGVPNRGYQLFRSGSIDQPDWQAVWTLNADDTGHWGIGLMPFAGPSAFYRLEASE